MTEQDHSNPSVFEGPKQSRFAHIKWSGRGNAEDARELMTAYEEDYRRYVLPYYTERASRTETPTPLPNDSQNT